jgi:large subunit ribosomal protein L27
MLRRAVARWPAQAAAAAPAVAQQPVRHASKKAGKSCSDKKGTRIPKRLGVKIFGGSFAPEGAVLVRQRGTKFHPGRGVFLGRDHTLNAACAGIVTFTEGYLGPHHIGRNKRRRYVSVLPPEDAANVAKVKHLAKCRNRNKARAAIRFV